MSAEAHELVLRGGLVDTGSGAFRRTDVAISAGRIAEIGDGLQGGSVVDCGRFAVVPGAVNAHVHSNENWFRGLWDNLPLEPWMLFSYPVLAAPPQSPREVYVRTLLGGIEMLRSGATCASTSSTSCRASPRSRSRRSSPPTVTSACAP